MLESLRNASKGWMAGILIFLLVASFGLWGVQDWLNLTTNPTIAKVGDVEITPDQFSREFNRFLQQMERQSGVQLSSVEAKKLNLDREALDRMLTRFAILDKAKDVGLEIPQAQLVDIIRAIPGMSDGQGGINQNALQQLLQQAQLNNQAEFMDLVRGDVLRQQLVRTMLAGVQMPPGLDAALNRFRLERRVVEYVLIDPSRAGEMKDPDDATLRKLYDANAAARYSLPEFRTVSFVHLRSADVAAQVQVTEDEIKRIYDANKRTYETPEKRVLEQIKFKTEAAARDAKAKLAAGTTFEAIAKAEGFKPEDIKLGEVGKDNTTIPKVAFEVALNTPSEPVRGPFGWVILRALSSTPGTLKTLAEVHDEIRDRIAAERSKDKLFELTSDFEDALGAGKTLEEAATTHKLTVTKVTIDARGNDAEGKTVEGLPGGEFLQRVFGADRAADSGLIEAGEGAYFEFRVDDVKPTAKKPFAQVRADVLADWRAQELDKRLQAMADDLVKKGNAGKSMAELAAPLGVAPLTSDPLPRYGDNRTFGAETVTAAHEAKVGAYFKGPVADGKSVVVGRLAAIQYEAEAPNAPLRATYSSRLREVFANDFAEQLGTAVRSEVGVTVDEARFQAFHTGE